MTDDVLEFYMNAAQDIAVNMTVADLDQHITMWRNDLSDVGVDITDPVILEAISIFTFRLLSLIVSVTEFECEDADHINYHIQSGAAPAVLLIHSALRTYT